MKVYGHPISTCTRKVLTTILEKGHKPELEVVDIMNGAHKQPAHLARQPFGQIPSIDDDGFVLYESRAIIRYLDAKLTGPQLTPADLKQRARMEQWISVETSNFTPIAMKLIYNLYFNKFRNLPTDEAVVAQAKKDIQLPLSVLDDALGKSEYLAGAFSLAEIGFMPYVEYLHAAGVGEELVGAHKHVASWWSRISQRPSWKQVTAK
ncbi:MAG TPA: glutathione S-transferase N-terminal domain-containing protein [Byssovorax sp.]|jgi:glutathione S-transferase